MRFMFSFILTLLMAQAAWAYQLQVRTHDQRNPFNPDVVKIVNEGGRSWKLAPWAPIVQVIAKDPSNVSNTRDATGFFVAKFQDQTTQGVLILTDYHVLPVTPAFVSGSNTSNIMVRFFDQTHRVFNNIQKIAKPVAVSSFADLVLLKVELSADDLAKNIILPPLAVSEPKNFEKDFWAPMAFKINPLENLSQIIGYSVSQSINVTNMSTVDAVNSLSAGVDAFWNIPGDYQQGMSGGPLVAMKVVDQDNHPLKDLDVNGSPINYEEVFFGALGFIYDIGTGNGYAYPFSRYFIDMMNAAPKEDLSRQEKISLPATSQFTIAVSQELPSNYSLAQGNTTYHIYSPTITAVALKQPTGVKVSDGIELDIDGCAVPLQKSTSGANTYLPCSKPMGLSLTQEIDLTGVSYPTGGGTPGSGGNGTPGTGGNGTPGGGGNGTPGTGSGINGQSGSLAKYKILLTARSENQWYGSSVISYYTAPGLDGFIPIRHIKELLATLLSTHYMEVKIADPYYDYDSYEKAIHSLEDPQLLNDLHLADLGNLFDNFPAMDPSQFKAAIVSGRFVGTKPGARVISGRVDVTFGKNQPGQQYTLEWRISLLHATDQWQIQGNSFTLNNQPLSLKSAAQFSVQPDYPNGRLRLTLKSGNNLLGTVWP